MLLAFDTMDHAALSGLGHLDMAGIRPLCVLDDACEVAYEILIRTTGGGAPGTGGGGGGVGTSGGGNDFIGSLGILYRVLAFRV